MVSAPASSVARGHAAVDRRAGLRGLAASPRRTRTTDSRHGYPIAPNRLSRNFQAAAPGQVWLADLTYILTGEGWLYLAAYGVQYRTHSDRLRPTGRASRFTYHLYGGREFVPASGRDRKGPGAHLDACL
jgi:transposase InsO family protein